jgi:regulator of protease activity HflC (stomatin/prohibitin superfamily)
MAVEIKRVETPEDMQRAIAKQAEAERIRRSKIILAEGEFQAAAKLREAADVLQTEPIKLRYLETLSEAAREKSVTILFPMELTDVLKKLHP